MSNIKFIELFAGIGGFRYGLESVGYGGNTEKPSKNERVTTSFKVNKREWKPTFSCIYTNEFNKYAAQIYKERFKDEIDTRDIREVKAEEIPDHDLLTAGFPCQAFSISGKRGGFEDTRGTLFFEIARIAQQKQPRLLLLENVKGLLSHDKGRTFGTILNTLDELGYDLQWQVLNSKNFGVPQNRERVFIIGHLRGTSRPEVFPIGGSAGTPPKELTQGMNQADRAYSPEGSSPTIPTSGGGRHEPKIGVAVQDYELRPKEISNTLDANYWKGIDNHQARTGVMEGMKIRKLTPTECERLQGFPDGWAEGISDTQRYKCLGNAVTTNVIAAIGEKLCLDNTEK